jgi:hypothetical protein
MTRDPQIAKQIVLYRCRSNQNRLEIASGGMEQDGGHWMLMEGGIDGGVLREK